MYRILFLGQDKANYSRLRDSLPLYMRLEPEGEIENLQNTIRSVKPHGIILPISNPGPDEFSYIKKVIDTPHVPGIIVTANYMTAAQAVSCMRFGAYDCLTGPMNGRTIGASLDRMIQPSIPDKQLFSGESSIIMIMQKRLIQYSSLPYPVLITGETGSGKDLAAKTIHLQGNRREKSFTAVNCASYPEDLLTTELFGSLKGAFTGSTDRPGLFESSSGGTLFLDEIGELSLRNQGSLLRVIEDGYVRRMGSHKTKKIDVRIIAATNKNLRKCIRHGSFRSDLFYRLNLLGITIPPLRKRKEDIPGLTREYLKTIQTKTPWQVENRAMSVLIRHNWPGNVRELQSVLLRASLSSENNKIRASDLFISDTNEDLPLFSEVL